LALFCFAHSYWLFNQMEGILTWGER